MPCCGSKRQLYTSPDQRRSDAGTSPDGLLRTRAGERAPVTFEYAGKTGLSVSGPITGRFYRFNHEGATVTVDARDAPGLVAVPGLRVVRTAARSG